MTQEIQKIKTYGGEFYLRPLKKEDIEETLQLMDQCVGENLYQKTELEQTIGRQDRAFLLLKTAEEELAGYIYYYLTSADQIAEDARLAVQKIRQVCGLGAPVRESRSARESRSERESRPVRKPQFVGKLQSVGIKEAFRRQGLAVLLMEHALAQFAGKGVENVFIICWNAGGKVPLEKALQKCQFAHLSSAKQIWYDKKDLFCPYCKGRCKCDAEVYFKRIHTGNPTET